MTLNISAVLVCDDVRREDNGKLILIGVYGQDIRAMSFPATVLLNVVIRLHNSEPIDTDVEFQWSVDGTPNANQKGHLTLASPGVFLFHVALLPIINIPSDALLDLQWRVGDGGWETIYSIPLLKPDPPQDS